MYGQFLEAWSYKTTTKMLYWAYMNKLSIFSWRPATTLILLGGFVLILVALVISFIWANFKPTTSVQVGGGVYHVWIAKTASEREKGLSGVEHLKVNGGLLMVFDEDGNNPIWMKDMLIPLDIVWIDANKKVVHIEREVDYKTGTSKTYMPKKLSRYVLELPAGSVSNAGIKVGQSVEFNIGDTI